MEHQLEEMKRANEHVSSIDRQVTLRYAGLWIRFAALLIDMVVLGAVFLILIFAAGASPLDPPASVSLIHYAIEFTYYILLTALYGQTLGKMMTGIRIVRKDGKPLSWGTVIIREIIGKFVSALILFIGFVLAGMDSEKRALHDRIAGTRVVRK